MNLETFVAPDTSAQGLMVKKSKISQLDYELGLFATQKIGNGELCIVLLELPGSCRPVQKTAQDEDVQRGSDTAYW